MQATLVRFHKILALVAAVFFFTIVWTPTWGSPPRRVQAAAVSGNESPHERRSALDEPPPLRCPAAVRYLHSDVARNVWAKTDEFGTVVWRGEQRPFGLGTVTLGADPLRFAGQEVDDDIALNGGLYLMGTRFHDPLTGRFLSTDPLALPAVNPSEPQRFNRFVYSLNNPYRFQDRTGREPEAWYDTDAIVQRIKDKYNEYVEGKAKDAAKIRVGPVEFSGDVNDKGNPVFKAEVGGTAQAEVGPIDLEGGLSAEAAFEADPKSDFSMGNFTLVLQGKLKAALRMIGIDHEFNFDIELISTTIFVDDVLPGTNTAKRIRNSRKQRALDQITGDKVKQYWEIVHDEK